MIIVIGINIIQALSRPFGVSVLILTHLCLGPASVMLLHNSLSTISIQALPFLFLEFAAALGFQSSTHMPKVLLGLTLKIVNV